MPREETIHRDASGTPGHVNDGGRGAIGLKNELMVK
jgi:hypothetical protein